jgi:hypothetical protein
MAIDESLNSAQSCRVCLKDFCRIFDGSRNSYGVRVLFRSSRSADLGRGEQRAGTDQPAPVLVDGFGHRVYRFWYGWKT